MKSKNINKIGILDGMGAFAGARFFQMTLEKISANHLNFPEIILNAVSVDDFISDPLRLIPAQKILSSRVREFNHQNVSMIVMACNTAHLIHPHLQRISHSIFPSIIDLVVLSAKSKKLRRVGILASPMTLKTKLYETAITKAKINSIVPEQKFQNLLEKIIRNVISNSVTNKDRLNFEQSTREFVQENNLDGLILGCTELPLVFPKDKFKNVQILDSLEILADSVVDHLKC